MDGQSVKMLHQHSTCHQPTCNSIVISDLGFEKCHPAQFGHYSPWIINAEAFLSVCLETWESKVYSKERIIEFQIKWDIAININQLCGNAFSFKTNTWGRLIPNLMNIFFRWAGKNRQIVAYHFNRTFTKTVKNRSQPRLVHFHWSFRLKKNPIPKLPSIETCLSVVD